jgi:ABC-2 type transport system ATP-binding protein
MIDQGGGQPPGGPVLEARNLTVDFAMGRGKKVRAVDGLDLAVQPGEVVGFIGPNGAGKSTTIKVLMGFLRPTAGEVRVFGKPVGNIAERRRLGFLPEVALYYPWLTARETLRLFADLSEIPKAKQEGVIDELLERVGLTGRDKESLRGFSKGMLQRVGIAQAIMGDPEVLVLDEVTSGLDPVARYDVRRILMDFKARGRTVFFSSHELTEVTMLCDRVIIVDSGKVLDEGSIEHLLAAAQRYHVRIRGDQPLADIPEGVMLHSLSNGFHVYVAETEESVERLRASAGGQNLSIEEVEASAASLEDYFVRRIGRKVT